MILNNNSPQIFHNNDPPIDIQNQRSPPTDIKQQLSSDVPQQRSITVIQKQRSPDIPPQRSTQTFNNNANQILTPTLPTRYSKTMLPLKYSSTKPTPHIFNNNDPLRYSTTFPLPRYSKTTLNRYSTTHLSHPKDIQQQRYYTPDIQQQRSYPQIFNNNGPKIFNNSDPQIFEQQRTPFQGIEQQSSPDIQHQSSS